MDRGHALLDVGGGARLERFGARVTDRPHPGALGARGDPAAWAAADLRFDRDRGWSGGADIAEPWPIEIDGLALELRATEAGQVGLFPEHAAMLPWLREQVAARVATGSRPSPGRAARRPAPVRLHRAGDAGHGRGGCLGRPCRRLQADRRLGTSQRRALRPGRSPGPLDRRRRRLPSPSARSGAAVDTPASSSTHRVTGTDQARAPGASRTISPPSSPRPAACSRRTASSS